jgi:hypothetical protein
MTVLLRSVAVLGSLAGAAFVGISLLVAGASSQSRDHFAPPEQANWLFATSDHSSRNTSPELNSPVKVSEVHGNEVVLLDGRRFTVSDLDHPLDQLISGSNYLIELESHGCGSDRKSVYVNTFDMASGKPTVPGEAGVKRRELVGFARAIGDDPDLQ